MILEINKKVLLNENKYINSAIGLGIGAGVGAGLSDLAIDHQIDNLHHNNEDIVNGIKNGTSVKLVGNPHENFATNDNSTVTATVPLKNFSGPDSVIPKITINGSDGQHINVNDDIKKYLGNQGIAKSLTSHRNDLIGIGAGLGASVGTGIAYGGLNSSKKPAKEVQEASVVGIFTNSGQHIKLPKQASKKTISDRLKANASAKLKIKDKTKNPVFKISEDKNPFKPGSVDSNRFVKDKKFHDKFTA